MRGFLLPSLQFSPTLSYLSIMLGLIFNMTGLLWVGIFFFALMVLFSILTLPVEINASTRGLRMLREAGLLKSENDTGGARQVLTAAALTYLAAAITSILQLLYYISVAQRRR
jgi:Zn-dependent membrane protease YugP